MREFYIFNKFIISCDIFNKQKEIFYIQFRLMSLI